MTDSLRVEKVSKNNKPGDYNNQQPSLKSLYMKYIKETESSNFDALFEEAKDQYRNKEVK